MQQQGRSDTITISQSDVDRLFEALNRAKDADSAMGHDFFAGEADPKSEPEPQSVQTIAEILGVTTRRVQQLVREGVIPKLKYGRYDLASVVHSYITYLREVAGRSRSAKRR